jgi:hypothetical protein
MKSFGMPPPKKQGCTASELHREMKLFIGMWSLNNNNLTLPEVIL